MSDEKDRVLLTDEDREILEKEKKDTQDLKLIEAQLEVIKKKLANASKELQAAEGNSPVNPEEIKSLINRALEISNNNLPPYLISLIQEVTQKSSTAQSKAFSMGINKATWKGDEQVREQEELKQAETEMELKHSKERLAEMEEEREKDKEITAFFKEFFGSRPEWDLDTRIDYLKTNIKAYHAQMDNLLAESVINSVLLSYKVKSLNLFDIELLKLAGYSGLESIADPMELGSLLDSLREDPDLLAEMNLKQDNIDHLTEQMIIRDERVEDIRILEERQEKIQEEYIQLAAPMEQKYRETGDEQYKPRTDEDVQKIINSIAPETEEQKAILEEANKKDALEIVAKLNQRVEEKVESIEEYLGYCREKAFDFGIKEKFDTLEEYYQAFSKQIENELITTEGKEKLSSILDNEECADLYNLLIEEFGAKEPETVIEEVPIISYFDKKDMREVKNIKNAKKGGWTSTLTREDIAKSTPPAAKGNIER